MKHLSVATGKDIREMFSSAAAWLEKSAPEIDAINVFPVPDGDTGTNMLMTMRSTVEEAYRVPDDNASTVLKSMAYGALMGARGNSGVILSQIVRGIAKSFDNKESITGIDFAESLKEASDLAYKGVSNPVEGTILTVVRDAAAAAAVASEQFPNDLLAVVEASSRAARESVLRTPSILAVLKEAGVVDAGGEGLYVILQGLERYLKGETDVVAPRKPELVASGMPLATALLRAPDEDPYGYCTEFVIEGHKLDSSAIQRRLRRQGQSLIVVGDDHNVRVHVHTLTPGAVLLYATSLGILHGIKIENMDDQHRDFVAMQRQRQPMLDTAVIAVAAGEGMKEVFRSLGVAQIVSGGQTMNPSVRELLQAVELVQSDKVVLLPNNKNIILAASQILPLTSKQVSVIPSKTMAQGIASLLAFNYEGDYDDNVKAMTEAVATVKTLDITTAVRSTRINGMTIKSGQVIAVYDDQDIVASGTDVQLVAMDALAKISLEKAEVITVYYGQDTPAAEADSLADQIRLKYPGKQIEVVNGGQPHYRFMISAE
jgi:DAK2 domain fusion protein YloV